MSADAYVRCGATGRAWSGSHDGPCRDGICEHTLEAPDHAREGSLAAKISEIEYCLSGRAMRWEIETLDTGECVLRGWCA